MPAPGVSLTACLVVPPGTLAAAGTSAAIAAVRPGSAAAGTTPGATKAALLSRGAATPGAYGGTPGAALKSRSAAVEDPIKIALSEIFRKIGQKEHMEQVCMGCLMDDNK